MNLGALCKPSLSSEHTSPSLTSFHSILFPPQFLFQKFNLTITFS